MDDRLHSPEERPPGCVIALHCSLGSGRQWARLAEQLGSHYRVIAPDISGYGSQHRDRDWPNSLAQEVGWLRDSLTEAAGPIHLVGHSYGGAIAFKIATDSPFADRVRSLTLIEPVLPTLLCDDPADRRLHDRFAELSQAIYKDLWRGLFLEAVAKFTEFWNGSGPPEAIPASARLRMLEHAEKIAFDFRAILGEENVATAAATLRVPTLLFSGGLSPYLTQRTVARLAAIIAGAEARHLPTAGHMLPLTHAAVINPDIAGHIVRADELAGISPASAGLAADRLPSSML